jgi:hypothetical protein
LAPPADFFGQRARFAIRRLLSVSFSLSCYEQEGAAEVSASDLGRAVFGFTQSRLRPSERIAPPVNRTLSTAPGSVRWTAASRRLRC